MKLINTLNRISGNCFFEGKMFIKDTLLSQNEIISLFCNAKSRNDILGILSNINGFFYLAIETEHEIFLISDIVRTYPIFYKISDDIIYIDDNAINLSSDDELSWYNVDIFLASGYTIGNKTIFQNIFQVEAASLVSISKIDGKTILTSYYSVVKFSYSNFEKKELFSKLNKIYKNIVQKLLDYSQGRMIVIPLSGGYDSRLIAMTLKQLGAENVICYAYGTKHPYDINHLEIKTSRNVANSLGYKWIYVEYSYSKWNKLIQDQASNDYIKYVSRGSSLVSYQDWLAISELKKKNLLPDDCVFVPGHTGDFITGSAIPADIEFDKVYNKLEILRKLSGKYFNLFPFIDDQKLLQFCENFFQLEETYNAKDYINVIEMFCWREYHSKHICNSAQIYKFYNYNWYFPLWDREIVDFWFSIDPEYRRERKLFREFIDECFETSIPYVSNSSNTNLFLKIIFKICKITGIEFLISNYYGISKTGKLSLFFKNIPVIGELKNSFILNNCSNKLRKISINGLGSLHVITNILERKL